MSYELNSWPVKCPKCEGSDCRQLDEAKVECLDCGEVFVHPVLVAEEAKAA
jgi:ribosomal protein S27E